MLRCLQAVSPGAGDDDGDERELDPLEKGALVLSMQTAAVLCDAHLAFIDFLSLSSKSPLSTARRLLLISAHLLEQVRPDTRNSKSETRNPTRLASSASSLSGQSANHTVDYDPFIKSHRASHN